MKLCKGESCGDVLMVVFWCVVDLGLLMLWICLVLDCILYYVWVGWWCCERSVCYYVCFGIGSFDILE